MLFFRAESDAGPGAAIRQRASTVVPTFLSITYAHSAPPEQAKPTLNSSSNVQAGTITSSE